FRLQPQVGRSVAQPGSALASGARGREFESPRSDQHLAQIGTTYARDNARETQRVDCARRYEDMASTVLFLPPRPSCDRPLLAGHRRDVAGGAVLEVRPMMAVDLLQSSGRHAQVAGGFEDRNVLLHHVGRSAVAQNVRAVLALVAGGLGDRGPTP